ncbi:MAG: type VII secretion-associated serine protease mycosin [Gordonia sp. (in: high G+C Gram-positive bacteria)]|uniref:type VII secretion-associated serine protease mycosin n=1 Tax=Gordonia sp. (in: high G+C Gram-positive bacteria) TaxID=84139 RepID=UPI003C742254
MIRRLCAATGVAAVFAIASAWPAAASPRPAVIPAAVVATPLGPPEPTEQRANCASVVDAVASDQPPGHRLLNVSAAHDFSRGGGVKVAVIDTGVSPHARLPRLVAGGDYVGTGDGLSDCDMHGTLVAGIIAGQGSIADGFVGVAPDSTIISIRQSSGAYSAKNRGADGAVVGAGFGPIETLARAVIRAIDLGARVINISEVACLPAGVDIGDGLLGAALAQARARDVVVVVAAGNLTETTGCRDQNPAGAGSPELAWAQVRTAVTPARFSPLVLTVAAVDATNGAPAEFSLRGPWVGVAAPGTQVVSLAPGSAGPRLVDSLRTDDGLSSLAGTSYAAPYVAGVAALIRSRFPHPTAPEVVDRIVRTAHGGGHDLTVGSGLVDPVAALTTTADDRTAVPPRALASDASPNKTDPGTGVILAGVGIGCCVLLARWLLKRR